METNIDSAIVRVKDLGLASYIFANGIRTLRSERSGNTIYFLFPESQVNSLENSYWNDLPPFVPARQLFAAQRSLKDQIFNSLPEEGT